MNEPGDMFTKDVAQSYDRRNSRLAPISDNLHFLTAIVLEGLRQDARVLSVGAGTGAEILALAKEFPGWSFVALEPSRAMLDVCRARLASAGLGGRCEFVHGTANDLSDREHFDAALSMLVAHFVERENRLPYFQEIVKRLQPGGYLVNAEISFDLEGTEFPPTLENWKSVQRLMGGTPESLARVAAQLKDDLKVLSPAETESLLRRSGVEVPVRFFQAFMVTAWYGTRAVAPAV